MPTTTAKEEATKQWTNNPCGLAGEIKYLEKYTPEFYEGIDKNRYEEYAPWLKTYIDSLDLKGKKLLEIGFGMGTDLFNHARNGAEANGIDLSPEHLNIASKRFALNNIPANLQLHDATAIPFEDNTFDVVYSFGVIHHIDDTKKVVEEIHRVLKPGGKAVLGVYNYWSAFHLLAVSQFPKPRSLCFFLNPGYRRKKLSEIEYRDDENDACPLVKMYSQRGFKELLKNFGRVKVSTHHLGPAEFGQFHRLVSPQMAKRLENKLGWYHMATATK